MSDLVTLTHDHAISTMTLNRADARNALSMDLLDAMHRAIDELARTDTHVLVLTGSGKAFSAGMDLKAVLIELSGDETLGEQLLTSLARFTLKLRALPKVVIASVNGAAIGGGCGITCVCDITISHADAKLGFPEVDLGLCPAVIAPWVVRKLGPSVARHAMLMGGVMSGVEAHAIGLVDHLAPSRDDLDTLTNTVAWRLASGGPKALATTKDLLNSLDHSLDETQLLRAAQLSASVLRTPDAQAALAARMNPAKG